MPIDHNVLQAELEIQINRFKEEVADSWVVVCTDTSFDRDYIVNVVGPYETSEAALIRSQECYNTDEKMRKDGMIGPEVTFTYRVVPMFSDQSPLAG